jgi:hypothetical protein
MANQKITELRSLTSASIQPDDLFVVVDLSETTSPTGETKNISFEELSFAINTGSGSLEVIKDKFVFTTATVAIGSASLTDTPIDILDATVDIRHAPAQVAGIDYTITGSTIYWAGLDLDGQLGDGDIMTVKYQRIID